MVIDSFWGHASIMIIVLLLGMISAQKFYIGSFKILSKRYINILCGLVKIDERNKIPVGSNEYIRKNLHRIISYSQLLSKYTLIGLCFLQLILLASIFTEFTLNYTIEILMFFCAGFMISLNLFARRIQKHAYSKESLKSYL